jgi:hypothetical protein
MKSITLIILLMIFKNHEAYSQLSLENLKTGTYVSNCFPKEKIAIFQDAGKNWWVGSILRERGAIKKEYILVYNFNPIYIPDFGSKVEIKEDPKNRLILRIKSTNEKLISITGIKSFKTSEGCLWALIPIK